MLEQMLPEHLPDLPEVGCLSGEGGAVDLPYLWEVVRVVTPEVGVDTFVCVYAQKLCDYLHCDDFRVGELGGRAARAVASMASFEMVVYEAEDRDDEGVNIHERRPPLRRLVWTLLSVGRSSLWIKPSWKLAHGVFQPFSFPGLSALTCTR